MKTKLLSISILILIGLAQSLEGKDLIKDKSPDGRFALRIRKGEEGWEAAIVDLRAKKPLADLEVYGNYIEDMRSYGRKIQRSSLILSLIDVAAQRASIFEMARNLSR
jgi:hypothetical protein